MSKILLPDFIVISSGIDASGRLGIIGKCIADNFSDLPVKTYFDKYTLENGSTGTTSEDGADYIMDSTGVWHKVDKSPYADVYTKTEVDNLISPIRSDLDAVIQSNSNQSLYLYALIGQSSLNLLDSSVWSGQTPAGAGYICQDLAISLPAGTYAWKMQRDGNTSTSFVLRAADNTELFRVTRGAGVNDITQVFTIADAAAKISIYAGYSITYHDNMIFKVLT